MENYFTKLFMVSHTGLIFIPYIDSLVQTLNRFRVYVRRNLRIRLITYES